VSLLFPNVPNLPGVPPLNRSPLPSIEAFVNLGSSIGTVLGGATQQSLWGIFDQPAAGTDGTTPDATRVIQPDSIREFSKRAEWRISNYPVQQGSFTSYNKVRLPPEYAVKMVKGGSLDDRTLFEANCEAVSGSINLYTIMTPEKTHIDCSVSRFEIERKGAPDAYFEEVYLYFQKIIQEIPNYSTTPNTSNATSPSAVPNASQGTVTATAPDPGVTAPLATVGIQ
jgi:hypothetical protein